MLQPPPASPFSPLLDEAPPSAAPPLLELELLEELLLGAPHLPALHAPPLHSAALVQASPSALVALQTLGFAAVSQNAPAPQSALPVHALSHLPEVHEPLVHCEAAVHAPPSARLATHILVPAVSQNCAAEQSASRAHVVPHAPVVALQIGPAWVAPAHSAFVVHLPHEPSALTKGFASVGHGAEAAVPLSPFAATHAPVAWHTGAVATLHNALPIIAPKPPSHATHAPVVVLQRGLVPTQAASLPVAHSVH